MRESFSQLARRILPEFLDKKGEATYAVRIARDALRLIDPDDVYPISQGLAYQLVVWRSTRPNAYAPPPHSIASDVQAMEDLLWQLAKTD